MQSTPQTTITTVDSDSINSNIFFILDILLITVGFIIILFAIAILIRLK